MSSPMGNAGPARSFQSRLNRVEKARAPHEAQHPEVSVLPDWKSDVFAKSGLPLAVVIGMLSALAVRAGLYHYSGKAMLTDTPDMTLAIETSAALLVSFLAFMVLPFRGLSYKLALLAGVAVTIVAMHNAVHSAPGLFSLMFSPEWTERVIAATEPKSLLIRGEVIPLMAPTDEAKALPTILRLN